MQWVTHDLSKCYIILYDQLKKNAVVDCCDFTLSETDIRIENSIRKPEHFRVFFYMSVDMYLLEEEFDFGIFSRKNSLGRNDVDMEIKKINCVNELQNQRIAKALSDDD